MVIKDFATSTNFEAARRQFHYEKGKSKADMKQTIGLHCLHTIPRRVKFLHDDQITFNMHKMCSEIYNLIQHQKLGFQINTLKMRSRKK